MATVIHLPSRCAGTRLQSSTTSAFAPVSSATPITTLKTDGIARQQAIENALSMALFHIRQNESIESIRAATGRAIRAASMLKQACEELAMGEVAAS